MPDCAVVEVAMSEFSGKVAIVTGAGGCAIGAPAVAATGRGQTGRAQRGHEELLVHHPSQE